MSILIKGMEKPVSCNACMFDVYGLCLINSNLEAKDELTHSCPLIPIPPHGDLIDRDALEMERRAENAQKGWHDSFAVVFNGDPYYEAVYDCTEQFKELVNNAPTIIPAEEGET